MIGVQHNYVVQAFPPDRADETLHMPILPGGVRLGRAINYAMIDHRAPKNSAITLVIVPDQEPHCSVKWSGA